MKGATVKILATVRNIDLLPSTLLVFQTLRVGFPTARVEVVPNLPGALRPDDHEMAVDCITMAAKDVGAVVHERNHTRHDLWLEQRILMEMKPFVICDTDMVFHASMEDIPCQRPMVGPWEPEHVNPVTGMRHHARLHTCCMYLDPAAIRETLRTVIAERLPKQPWMIEWNPVRGAVRMNHAPETVDEFWDTTAQLLPVIQHDLLSREQCERFTHLHAGTWRDQAEAGLPGLNAVHRAAIAGTLDFKSVREAQAAWYLSHKP